MNKQAYSWPSNYTIKEFRPGPVAIFTQQKAGRLCRACEARLPMPHTSGLKYCSHCAGKRLVVFLFTRDKTNWFCRFKDEYEKQILRRVVYLEAAKIRETARRGNGIMTPSEQAKLEVAIDVGSGRILLRLSESQYSSLIRSAEHIAIKQSSWSKDTNLHAGKL